MNFKKKGYDASYLFSQTPSSIFLATVEALEHHYQFELIEVKQDKFIKLGSFNGFYCTNEK